MRTQIMTHEIHLEDQVVGKLREAKMIRSKHNWKFAAPAAIALAGVVGLAGLQSSWFQPSGSAGHQYILALYSGPHSAGGNAKEYGALARAHHDGRARVIGGDELAPA